MKDSEKMKPIDYPTAIKLAEENTFAGRVCLLLDKVYHGFYHFTDAGSELYDYGYYLLAKKVREMATWDFNRLTTLVILAHDLSIRVEIRPQHVNYLSILFHDRKREGKTSERHPTIEEAIATARNRSGVIGKERT